MKRGKDLLEFTPKLKELNEIGENFFLEKEDGYTSHQISRTIYHHGQKLGKKFSVITLENGFLITLVSFR